MRTRDSAHKGREGGRDSEGEEHRKEMIFPSSLHGDQKALVRFHLLSLCSACLQNQSYDAYVASSLEHPHHDINVMSEQRLRWDWKGQVGSNQIITGIPCTWVNSPAKE